MNENIQDILADNTEVLIDTLIENDIIKEIPILGTSLKLIRGIQNIRDRAYLNKIKIFIKEIGDISNEQRIRLIEESKKNEKSRSKFGDAIYTAIEQSDATVKIEYIAVVFEAFLNKDIEESDLRLFCHMIRSTFSDELTDVIESDRVKTDLQYLVPIGLADVEYPKLTYDETSTQPHYTLSSSANQLRGFWKKYRIKK